MEAEGGGHVGTREGLQPGTLHAPRAQDTAQHRERQVTWGHATKKHTLPDSRLQLGSEGTILCLHPAVLRHRPRAATESVTRGWCESSHLLISVTVVPRVSNIIQSGDRSSSETFKN